MRDDLDPEEQDEEQEHEAKPPKSLLDALVRTRDDVQGARLRIGNRIGACERSGWESAMLDTMRDLAAQLETQEHSADRTISKLVKTHPVWEAWLSSVRGIGESLAAPLLEYLDPTAPHISCWYRYLGLHCDDDGDAAHKMRGEKAAWNHYLKTHCVFKIGGSFIKAGGFYRAEFDRVRAELIARPAVERPIDRARLWILDEPIGTTKAGTLLDAAHYDKARKALLAEGRTTVRVRRRPLHMMQMARRAAVKLFLSHLYAKWREVKGLPFDPPYAQARLGHTGYVPPPEAPAPVVAAVKVRKVRAGKRADVEQAVAV